MKNVKSSPKVALVQSLVKGAIVGLLMTSTAFAGNGAGYNGPTFNTISIPGAGERGIRVKNVAKAYNTCFAAGDSARGLVPYIAKVAQQFGFSAPEGLQLIIQTQTDSFNANLRSDENKAGATSYQAQAVIYYPKEKHTQFDSANYNILLDWGYSGLLVQLDTPATQTANGGDDTIQLVNYDEAQAKMPIVKYKGYKRDTAYDRWGRETKNEAILQGVTLEAPQTMKPILSNKDRPVISIDLTDFVSCLRSEIQNGLE